MITRDPSPVSGILIQCTACPWWFAFRDDPIEAYFAGESHESRVHGVDQEKAAQARRQYNARRSRHAG